MILGFEAMNRKKSTILGSLGLAILGLGATVLTWKDVATSGGPADAEQVSVMPEVIQPLASALAAGRNVRDVAWRVGDQYRYQLRHAMKLRLESEHLAPVIDAVVEGQWRMTVLETDDDRIEFVSAYVEPDVTLQHVRNDALERELAAQFALPMFISTSDTGSASCGYSPCHRAYRSQ